MKVSATLDVRSPYRLGLVHVTQMTACDHTVVSCNRYTRCGRHSSPRIAVPNQSRLIPKAPIDSVTNTTREVMTRLDAHVKCAEGADGSYPEGLLGRVNLGRLLMEGQGLPTHDWAR